MEDNYSKQSNPGSLDNSTSCWLRFLSIEGVTMSLKLFSGSHGKTKWIKVLKKKFISINVEGAGAGKTP